MTQFMQNLRESDRHDEQKQVARIQKGGIHAELANHGVAVDDRTQDRRQYEHHAKRQERERKHPAYTGIDASQYGFRIDAAEANGQRTQELFQPLVAPRLTLPLEEGWTLPTTRGDDQPPFMQHGQKRLQFGKLDSTR